MLTRVHFKKLAELAGSLALALEDHDKLVKGLADLCERENPRFIRSRFHVAAEHARSNAIAEAEDGETERHLDRYYEDGGHKEALNAVLSITMGEHRD